MPISSIENLTAPGTVQAINNDGQILFEAFSSGADYSTDSLTLSLQTGQTITTIGTFAGDGRTVHMNDQGQVAWSAYVYAPGSDESTDSAAVWENGQVTAVPALSSGFSPVVSAIDSSGRVYGYDEEGGTFTTLPPDWMYQNGVTSALSSDVTISNGTTIPFEFIAGNANGDLAGMASSYGSSQQKHLLLWKNGAIVDGGALSSAYVSIGPSALNSSDQIVGKEQTAYGLSPTTAFLSQNGHILDLPTLGAAYTYNWANAINDQGIIVGRDGTSITSGVAVAWQNGSVFDLNSLLPANSGWVLKDAVGINDQGQVVGTGTYNGATANFELTLTPQSFLAATAVSQNQSGEIYTITPIADSAANVSANLDALTAIATKGELGAITLTDSGTPVLAMTVQQVISDYTVLNAITGSYTIGISDSAANVSANFDGLQSLVAAGKVSSIVLTDSTVLSLTPTEVVNDTAALAAISGSHSLSIAAPATDSYIAGQAGVANTVVFSGNGSQYSVTPNGDGTTFAITGEGVTDHLRGVQALQFADHTDIVASATPPVAGAVSSAQVTELYGAVFGRTPDVSGLSFYQTYAAAHPTTAFLQFAEWFLASGEYTGNSAHTYAQTEAGDEQFITDSYQNLLHRAPSADEVSFYESKVIAPALANLTAGTAAYAAAVAQAHAQTLVYFSQSAEFLGDVQVTAQNPTSAQHWLILI